MKKISYAGKTVPRKRIRSGPIGINVSRAVELRHKGLTYRHIGEVLGKEDKRKQAYDERSVTRAIKRVKTNVV